MDGPATTPSRSQLAPEWSQLHEEEVLRETLPEPETAGLLLGGDPHRQLGTLHRASLLLQRVQQSRRINAKPLLHVVQSKW